MAYHFRSFRFPVILAMLISLSALTLVHAQEPTSSSAKLAPDLTLFFETASFIPDEHTVMYDENTGWVIDGCEAFFGTDNSMPGSYLRDARVLLQGQWHTLDTSCMYACEFCSFDASDVEVIPNPGGVGYRLEGRFSDGAGTYYATWLVSPMGTTRTRIVAGPAAARLSMIGTVREADASMQLRMIDLIIAELSTFKGELEAGTVPPANAEWLREMIVMLEMRKRTGIK